MINIQAMLLALAAGAATAQPVIFHSSRIAPVESLGGNGATFGEIFDISNGVIATNLRISNAPPIPIGNAGEVLLVDADTGLTLRRLIPTSSNSVVAVTRVAIDGNTVGAILAGSGSTRSLVAFDAVTGVQRFEIAPDAGDQLTDFFGAAIEVGDGMVAVGYPGYEATSSNPIELREKVELYDAQSGTSLGELESDVPGISEGFGHEICIHNGRVAVSSLQQTFDPGGSAERVIIFDGLTLQELFVIEPPAGMSDDAWFGDSVAMNDDYIVVSAPLDDAIGQASGSVHVFDANDGAYLRTLDIGATPNPTDTSDLSIEVDINEAGTIVVSMTGGTTSGASIHEASSGVRTGLLTPGPVPGANGGSDVYGRDAAIEGETIFVSDPGFLIDNFRNPSIFRFDPPVLIAVQPQDLVVDAPGQQLFMQVVANNADGYQWLLDGQPISDGPSYVGTDTSVLLINPGPEVAGQYTVEVTSTGFGSVLSDPAYYVYRGDAAPTCPADFNGDEVLNFFDISAYINAFNTGCP